MEYDIDPKNFSGTIKAIDRYLYEGLAKPMGREMALRLSQQSIQLIRQECQRVYDSLDDTPIPIWCFSIVLYERIVQKKWSVEKALKITDGKWIKLARKRAQRLW